MADKIEMKRAKMVDEYEAKEARDMADKIEVKDFGPIDEAPEMDAHAVEDLVGQYNVARAEKDFATSASIRINLSSQGIILKDTPCGTTWDRIEAPAGVDDTLDQRESTHGDYTERARIVQGIKELMRSGSSWDEVSPAQRQSLDMFADKMSRIVCGDPNEPDHWHDIEGYARLVSKELAPDGKIHFEFLTTQEEAALIKTDMMIGEKKLVRKEYVRAK